MQNDPDWRRRDLPPAPPAPGQQQPAEDPLVPHDFTGWTGRIVDAFGRSWRPVILLQLVLAVPLAIALAAFEHEAGMTVTETSVTLDHPGAAVGLLVVLAVVTIVLGAFIQLASFWIIVKQAAGRPAPMGGAARFAASRALPMIGWEIVAGVLIGVGLIVILPGIVLAVIILPTLLGAVGLERRGMRRCFELARGNFLALLGRCATALLIAAAYTQLIRVIVNIIFGRGANGVGVQIVAGVLQLPLNVVGVAFAVVTYAEMRGRHGRISTGDLSSALGR